MPGATESSRRDDLARIHLAKKKLGWDDDTYRDVMFTVCRTRSSGDLDAAGRAQFIAHLQRCLQAEGKASRGAARPPRTRLTPLQAKIWALWMQLADAGLVEHRTMKALDAWVLRHARVHKMVWLTGRQHDLVIESLKAWLSRREAPQ